MTKKLSNYNADDPNWGLFVHQGNRDLEQRKSIKVKLPIRQHIKLHALKLFSENNISETVERALDAYFAEMKTDGAPASEGSGASPGPGAVANALPPHGAVGASGPATGGASRPERSG
ncbi:MAG TPA: hypothetical protein VM889_12205 [Candidatus Thermoplasmatota archaeon]|nr:hypothetical protein [Candidatus Thermoplasmatota archaeon]